MNKRILLADDSLTIQKVVELTFMDEAFEVDSVGTGDDAIRRLEDDLPDVLIADVHMPGASGYEVCRRAKELNPGLPVLLLVGTFEALDDDEMAASGADGHLKKPFDSQELLQIVLGMTLDEVAVAEPEVEEEIPMAEGFEATGAEETEAVEEATEAPGEEVAAAGFDFDGGDDEGQEPVVGEALEMDDLSVDLGESLDLPEAEDVAELAGGDFDDEPFAEAEAVDEAPADAGDSPAETAILDADAFERLESQMQVAVEAEAEEPEPEPEPETAVDEAETAPEEIVGATDDGMTGDSTEAAEVEMPSATGALSDEDVERIARKVVEMLSEETVREVAWDVVPDLAEIVIKDRIRELESEAG